jgi:hypothetical protein
LMMGLWFQAMFCHFSGGFIHQAAGWILAVPRARQTWTRWKAYGRPWGNARHRALGPNCESNCQRWMLNTLLGLRICVVCLIHIIIYQLIVNISKSGLTWFIDDLFILWPPNRFVTILGCGHAIYSVPPTCYKRVLLYLFDW